MVERITDPHKPVRINGYGRLPDGRPGPYGVPQPARPTTPPPSRREYLIAGLAVAVVALAIVLRVAVLS